MLTISDGISVCIRELKIVKRRVLFTFYAPSYAEFHATTSSPFFASI